MDRRTFVKQTLGVSALAGTYLASGRFARLLAAAPPATYDLVAIKGGEPEVMFDRAIEVLGGMGAFVKKGQKVLVKPNIGWDVSPDRAGNTNPKLVSRIIQHCFNAGAKEVFVFDHTCDYWQRCYQSSGIEKAAKDAGARVAPAHSDSYYHGVSVPGGKTLKDARVHELVLESDVFINVPVLKHHSSTQVTIGMKNLMGIVWDRGYWHQNDVHQCIADFASYRKPDLTVVDAYLVLKQNGPRGVSAEDAVLMKTQLLSTDIVAADAAGAKLFGTTPDEIGYIKIAAGAHVGRKDLEKLSIKRMSI
ncbi:MAG TPA: DUF362 domain-containing protein [Bacteroidota bacterium]|nr:DUF362 domain-containing protein [Bacteroidota bacterium]